MALLGFPPPSSDEGLFVLLVFSVHLSMHASDVLYLSFANFDTLDFDSIFGFQGAMWNLSHNGLKWTRTTDLTLIRRAL